ncbi:MAG: signal peptidase II [Holosporaceae bacterium]|jgi:signal peptidase II|nr:signal peptidase II [Holosporaceae bacterium]
MQKMPNSFGSKRLIACLSAFILLSDQISKFIVVSSLSAGENYFVLPFLNIVTVKNRGVTFGLFNGVSQQLIWVLLSLAIVVSLCLWARNNRTLWLPTSMVIGGAIGNSIDRIVYDGVVDFLDFHLAGFHWPAFNVADSAIVIGIGILMLICYKKDKSMKYYSIWLLLILIGCGGHENDKIKTEDLKENNTLLVPPCLPIDHRS